MFPRTLFLLASFFGVLAACRCSPAVPRPVTVTIGDATIPIQVQVCANMVAFCPSSVPDGGEPVCETVVTSRYGMTPATMPTVLMCEAQAPDRATFVACQGVASCP